MKNNSGMAVGNRNESMRFREFLDFVAEQRPLPEYYFGKESALKWDVWRAFHLTRQVLKDYLAQKENLILDLGCGIGVYEKNLSMPGKTRVYGLDLCKGNLTKAASYAGSGIFINADAQRLPFKGLSFDCVIGVEILEHVLEPELLLEESSRILKDGGLMIIVVPLAPPLSFIEHLSPLWLKLIGSKAVCKGGFREHMRLYSQAGLVKQASKYFRVEKIINFNIITLLFPLLSNFSNKLLKFMIKRRKVIYKLDLLLGRLIFTKCCLILRKKE